MDISLFQIIGAGCSLLAILVSLFVAEARVARLAVGISSLTLLGLGLPLLSAVFPTWTVVLVGICYMATIAVFLWSQARAFSVTSNKPANDGSRPVPLLAITLLLVLDAFAAVYLGVKFTQPMIVLGAVVVFGTPVLILVRSLSRS